MKNKIDFPEVTEKSEEELEEIIKTIQDTELSDNTKNFIIKCIELAVWFPLMIQRKSISISRLRTLLFGKGYSKNKSGRSEDKSDGESEGTAKSEGVKSQPEDANKNIPNSSQGESNATTDKKSGSNTLNEAAADENKQRKGHGRMPHTVYKNCQEETIEINYEIGDLCPTLCGGKLGKYNPGTLIRIRGQNFADVTRYTIKKLRCNLCGTIIEPELPPEVGHEKYDASFKSMLALQKYYVAVPFYRQEQFQGMLEFPLSDSTQWDLIEQLAGSCYAPFNALKEQAANGNVIHNDDTKLRILEVIKEINTGTIGDRRGMFTTGIIANYEGHQIALFMNGTQHAGENLNEILKNRESEKSDIIQMCDGSSQNIPKTFSTILCNCLSHGFRKFEELVDFFPEECLKIIRHLGKVYENDKEARSMTDEQRLSYHQEYSKPVMDELKQYMNSLLEEHLVEPNSELGQAIKYMLKRWPELTRFLTVASAPIDNNIVERALKIAIRNRKAAMFYKTKYSAQIGGMITSLIYTCFLAGENPDDYLTMLQRHQALVNKAPFQWLPWNYRETLQSLEQPRPIKKDDANHRELSPPEDLPAAA